MRIIIVPNEPNPNMTGRHYGIAKALVARGHEVHTIVWDLPLIMSKQQLIKHMFTSWMPRHYDYEYLHIHKIGRLPLFWPVLNGVLFKHQLRKIHRTIGADIIFAESYTNETAIPKELPFIYDLADDYAAPADVFGSRIYKIAFKLLGVRKTMQQQCQRAVAVTTVSEVLASYARQYNNSVHTIPNGVETELISALKPAKNVPPNSMIYVSGFGPWSQPIMAMQAVIAARKNFPDASLTLVGEGCEVPKIKQFIADNKAENFIKYRGFIHDRKRVFELINQHAIGLNISEKNKWRDAAHPMKVIEYSALGKKVISTDLDGVIALGLPNIFMYAGNSDGTILAHAMQQALADTHRNYPTIAKQIRHEYNWGAIIDKLTPLLTMASALHRSVVHVTPSYPPALGGLEKVVQVLATTQKHMSMDVSVITARPGGNVANPHDVFPVKQLWAVVFANTTIMPGLLWRLLRISRNSIVHLHITQAFTPEIVWLASRLKRFRYVAHIHLDVAASGWAGVLLGTYKKYLLGRVLRAAGYVIVFTEDQRSIAIARYKLSPNRVVVIPNGVENRFFNDTPRTLHKPVRLLFVGRLNYQKNLGQLFEALAGISEKYKTTIVGDGELRYDLTEMVKKLQLKNIQFVGRAAGKKLQAYYQAADIFVLPSEREGMPLVLLEAMAMGLPVIATDVTGTRDVIQHGKNGLLVPCGDAEALQKSLVQLAASPIEYITLSTTARTMANSYSWPLIAEQFLTLYGTD